MSSRTADAFLLRASGSGDLTVADIALKNGANVNCTDQFGRRPILNAAQRCDHAMVAFLMKQGANPRCLGSDGMYPMALAAVMDRVDVMDALGAHCWDVESPSDMVPSALESALEAGRDRAARHLASHGAQVQTAGVNDESLLIRACMSGNVYSTRFLAEEGALWFAVDATGFNALDYAKRLNHHALMPALLFLARSEPLINPKKLFPLGLSARSRVNRKDLMNVETQRHEQELHEVRAMIARRVVAVRVTDADLAAHQNLDPKSGVLSDPGVDGADGDDLWIEVSEPARQTGTVRGLWSRATTGASKAMRGIKRGLASLTDDARIRLSSGVHSMANAMGHAVWLSPRRWARLRRTAKFIEALHAPDLMQARIVQLSGPILPSARDHNGTPLAVLVVRALNKTSHTTLVDVVGDTMDDPSELAYRLLKSLAIDGARTQSFDAGSGTGVGHAFMEGNHCSVYFRLLDERLYSNTLNRSNARMERPLHIAVRRRDVQAINGLLARGCDRNPVNRDGHAPLHHCALNSDAQIAEILIAAGANTGLKTRRGQGVQTMLKGLMERIETFTALLDARKEIQNVMSIFSPGNPMSSVVRNQQKSGQPAIGASKTLKILKAAKPAKPAGPENPDKKPSAPGPEDAAGTGVPPAA